MRNLVKFSLRQVAGLLFPCARQRRVCRMSAREEMLVVANHESFLDGLLLTDCSFSLDQKLFVVRTPVWSTIRCSNDAEYSGLLAVDPQ